MKTRRLQKKGIIFCSFLSLAFVISGCQGDLQGPLDDPGGQSAPITTATTTTTTTTILQASSTTTTTTLPGGSTADWDLDFRVSVPDAGSDSGVAANPLRAGQDVDATDEFDNTKDSFALLTGPVQAYFDHASEAGYDAAQGQDKLWYDFRAPGFPKSWNFVIWAMGGENVTVSWNLPNDPEPNCSTHSFIVTDRDAILADLDLCASGPLVYPGGGTNRTFTLTVSEK